MHEDCARTLALLRREKGVSQREAASALGISQGLLSHYENSIREPGLAFLVRACEYYAVSADFILGRTLNRNGTVISPEGLYDITTARDQTSPRGSFLAILNRKLLLNSVALLYDVLARTNSRDVIQAATNYLSDAVYTVYRRLYESNPKNDPAFFAVSSPRFGAGLADADMKCAEAELAEALSRLPGKGSSVPELSNEQLKKHYPDLCTSLLKLLQNSSERLKSLTKAGSSGTPGGNS